MLVKSYKQFLKLQRMEKFGEKLRALREQQGLSLRQLGNLLGVTKIHVWNLEKGKKVPNVAMVLKIAKVFNVTPNDLILDELDLD